jgi:hypothetical protein
MSNIFIKGDDVTITLWQGMDAPLIAGCNSTDTVGLTHEFQEVTPIANKFRGYLPTFIGGNLSFDSVLFFEGVTPEQAGINRHLRWILDGQLLNFSIRWTSGVYGVGLDGECYLQSVNITGAVNNYATGNISILITGEITLYEDYS